MSDRIINKLINSIPFDVCIKNIEVEPLSVKEVYHEPKSLLFGLIKQDGYTEKIYENDNIKRYNKDIIIIARPIPISRNITCECCGETLELSKKTLSNISVNSNISELYSHYMESRGYTEPYWTCYGNSNLEYIRSLYHNIETKQLEYLAPNALTSLINSRMEIFKNNIQKEIDKKSPQWYREWIKEAKDKGWKVIRTTSELNGQLQGSITGEQHGYMFGNQWTNQNHRSYGFISGGLNGYTDGYISGQLNQMDSSLHFYCPHCWENEDIYLANGTKLSKD